MTSLAHLGPPVPTEAPDTEPVTLHHWALLADLNGRGEAILSFTVTSHHQGARPAVLLLALRPCDQRILHATLLRAGGQTDAVPLSEIPGAITDLARTITRERFGRR